MSLVWAKSVRFGIWLAFNSNVTALRSTLVGSPPYVPVLSGCHLGPARNELIFGHRKHLVWKMSELNTSLTAIITSINQGVYYFSCGKQLIVRRAGLLWSQQDFEWRWSVPLFKCLTVLEFSFILFDLCLLITFFNFIMNNVPIVTFWIFTYHKIWILSIMFCFIWSYWIIYFLACLEVSWRVVS